MINETKSYKETKSSKNAKFSSMYYYFIKANRKCNTYFQTLRLFFNALNNNFKNSLNKMHLLFVNKFQFTFYFLSLLKLVKI